MAEARWWPSGFCLSNCIGRLWCGQRVLQPPWFLRKVKSRFIVFIYECVELTPQVGGLHGGRTAAALSDRCSPGMRAHEL